MNSKLNDNYLYSARGHSTTNSKRRFAGVASTALDEVPTSAFLISVPQSHKSRKSSRARFSTLFSCAIRRAALAWYCAIKNVHFRWYYTCACHDRWTVMASVCLPRNYTERENSDFGRYCVGKSCTSILMLIAVTRRSKKGQEERWG
jgi:hypothetical protein